MCEYEQSAIKELAQGKQNEKLAAHIKSCAECREALKVARWMQTFAAATMKPQALPAPGLLWWKAQLSKKQEAAKRALQPILWMQIMAAIIVIATLIWLIDKTETQLIPVWNNIFTSLEFIAAPLLIGLACVALICVVLAFKWREPLRKN